MQSLLLLLSKQRYLAPAWIFASVNIVMGTWVLYIPTIKTRLGLDDGDLGIALFSFSLGLLSIIPFSARIIQKVGLGRVNLIGICFFGLAMCLPVLASSFEHLCISLYAAGMLASLTDISMNALVSELEQDDGVNFMSAAHGFFSLGGVIGAGLGSLVLGSFALIAHHSLSVAIFIILTNLLLCKNYWRTPGKQAERESGGFKFSLLRPLLGLTVLAFLVMGSEGAIEHWSKLYLLDIVQIPSDRLASYGFVAFSATMTFGRFLGDGISARYGPAKIIIGGSLIASAGFSMVLIASYWSALIGFGLVGLGFSVIIPELFRLAGKTKGISPAEGISVVAGLGYVGFLASPALLGFLSDWSSLKLSFTVLLLAAITVCVIAINLSKRGAN